MKHYLKCTGVLVGIALVFVSFLFFGRKQGTYQALLISGLVTTLVFFASILFAKVHIKTKLFWIAIVILLAVVHQLIEPFLIDHSYRIFISENQSELNEINNLLMQKEGDITVSRDTVVSKGGQLSANETMKLKERQEKLGVYTILKFDKGLYYGLWGFLDVRLGISYLPGKSDPQKKYRHLIESWFR